MEVIWSTNIRLIANLVCIKRHPNGGEIFSFVHHRWSLTHPVHYKIFLRMLLENYLTERRNRSTEKFPYVSIGLSWIMVPIRTVLIILRYKPPTGALLKRVPTLVEDSFCFSPSHHYFNTLSYQMHWKGILEWNLRHNSSKARIILPDQIPYASIVLF